MKKFASLLFLVVPLISAHALRDELTNAPPRVLSYEERLLALYPTLGMWVDDQCTRSEYLEGTLKDLKRARDKEVHMRELEAISSAWVGFCAKQAPTSKQKMIAAGVVFQSEGWAAVEGGCQSLKPAGRECLSTNSIVDLVKSIHAECDKRGVPLMTNGLFGVIRK